MTEYFNPDDMALPVHDVEAGGAKFQIRELSGFELQQLQNMLMKLEGGKGVPMLENLPLHQAKGLSMSLVKPSMSLEQVQRLPAAMFQELVAHQDRVNSPGNPEDTPTT